MSYNGQHSLPKWLTIVVAILVILVGIQGFFLYRLYSDSVSSELLQAKGEELPALGSSSGSSTSTPSSGAMPLAVDSFFQGQDWDPFREIQQMREQMDRFFGDALNHFGQSGLSNSLFDFEWPRSPRIDLRETEDAYNVAVELPGADASTIKTNLEGQTLEITAALDQQSEASSDDESMGKVLRRERWVSRFARKIHLEHPVDADHMTSHFEDGILNVHLPKSKAT